ncbi:leucine-rich repeat protein [Lachnospiraceae bacterium OttesenSCG-928-D06]|nr:leucine-rich repeat protein [Lachnospiraceae bacterium OttesenSCG-928-D06]
MTKAVKTKKFRRLKKRIRKTLGALFLISAIAVAGIPVENLQASNGNARVTVDSTNSTIPIVDNNETIYTTGDGLFQFVYVNDGGTDKIAVILGCNTGYLLDGKLTVPDTVDAYSKYSYSLGSSYGYVAVGKDGSFLFYAQDDVVGHTTEVVKDEAGNIVYESDGKTPVTIEVPIYETRYYPCYYDNYSKWSNLAITDFYYMPDQSASTGDASNYAKVGDNASKQRIQGALVAYIGNQYIQEGTGSQAGTWTVAGEIVNSEDGIFANKANIKTLVVGNNLKGIGNYAFYNCMSLASISLSNALATLGNWSFANCMNLTGINIDLNSNIRMLGDHAFYRCTGLTSFNLPIAVTAIGDSAFEDCFNLESFVFGNGTLNVAFSTIGDYAFKNCRTLKKIEFPDTYSVKNMPISIFQGCYELESITIKDSTGYASFTDDTGYTMDDFKNDVPDEFYFEGKANSDLHTLAKENVIAFKYLDQDLYEIIMIEKGAGKNDKTKQSTYRVNSKNELVYCEIGTAVENVELPGTIGPYKVTIISDGSFQGNYTIKKITIPSSIKEIADNAFKGCFNLAHVIFSEPVNVERIGQNAFKTQDNASSVSDNASSTPSLTFTGPIDVESQPFIYAMNPGNYINEGSQVRSYIKFYSGWPENLVVQYNQDTDKNELVDYPTLSSLSSYASSGYPYMTLDYAQAAADALQKYETGASLFDYEQEIIDAALNIVLPEGIESIKKNLFIEKEMNDDHFGVDIAGKTLTTYGIAEIAANSFEGFTNLKSVSILGDTTQIGDYAFLDCENLEEANISATVHTLGLRPFAGCPKLTEVDFQGSPYFSCDNAVIYGLSDGEKTKIVQCLEARGKLQGGATISADELVGIKEIAEEAFRDCANIGSVNLSKSSISVVPESAFRGTTSLFSVYLPETCRSISDHAFWGSNLGYIEIPKGVSYISPDAFDTNKSAEQDGIYRSLEFYCVDDSPAHVFAQNYSNITTTSKPLEVFYTVYFWDSEIPATLLKEEVVREGEDATPPEAPEKEGHTFKGWSPDYHGVARDLDVVAQYSANDPDASKFTVTFLDHDDTVLKTTLVIPGEDAEAPVNPSREGYTFTGWRPAITDIQENLTTYAQYEKKDSTESEHTVRFIDYDDKVLYVQSVKDGGDAILPQSPTREGYTFTGWRPAVTNITKDTDTYANYEKNDGTNPDKDGDGDGDGDGNGDGNGNNGNGNGTNTAKYYTLTVKNGSGSGSYIAGAQVIVIANDPASGQEFDKWSIEPSTTFLASTAVTATVLTMPEGAVTVTANYKAGNSTTTGSGNTSSNKSSGSSSSNTSNTGSVNKDSNTSLIIDKNGISNTGVASATVNGSSDGFVIKITESSAASEAVVKALMAEYGDLNNIKYVPMDISLYDATGQTKITDTTGLSIRITIPLPDSLIDYAGNNKAAGVVNDRLDKLTASFTTIAGVPCITFTAEHFSPYVVYVDTSNLSAGTVTDDTPRTGDGIHPKWFLSIGLACISMILFMQRDKKTVKKRMVRA